MDSILSAVTSILQQQMQFMADACYERWKRNWYICLHERMHVSCVSGYIHSLYISCNYYVCCMLYVWRQGKIGYAINIPLMRIKNDSVNLAIIFAIERHQEAQPIRKTKRILNDILCIIASPEHRTLEWNHSAVGACDGNEQHSNFQSGGVKTEIHGFRNGI